MMALRFRPALGADVAAEGAARSPMSLVGVELALLRVGFSVTRSFERRGELPWGCIGAVKALITNGVALDDDGVMISSPGVRAPPRELVVR